MTSIRKAKKERKKRMKTWAEKMLSKYAFREFPVHMLTNNKVERNEDGTYVWNFPPVMKQTPSESMKQAMEKNADAWIVTEENGRRIYKSKRK